MLQDGSKYKVKSVKLVSSIESTLIHYIIIISPQTPNIKLNPYKIYDESSIVVAKSRKVLSLLLDGCKLNLVLQEQSKQYALHFSGFFHSFPLIILNFFNNYHIAFLFSMNCEHYKEVKTNKSVQAENTGKQKKLIHSHSDLLLHTNFMAKTVQVCLFFVCNNMTISQEFGVFQE